VNLQDRVLAFLDNHESSLVTLAQAIWDRPELAQEETFASHLLAEQLESAGFAIEWGDERTPTAFVASWGSGKPIIGVLGEYDALPGLSQKVTPLRDPVQEGAPGHGCGHNLLGVGAMAAALAAKDVMEQAGLPGTLRFYGCPAEETLLGKVLMARAGLFDDLDAALTWHPSYVNSPWASIATAVNSFRVNFYGIASHAAAAPELGRSALDGVQLMDVGVNYMREHIPTQARVHCVITEGGQVPNVVPAFAQVWYFVRAPNREMVDQIYAWMLDIARGAALMTGTTYDVEFLSGCYNTLPNDTLGDLLLDKMRQVGAPRYTQEEIALARQLQETFPPGSIEGGMARYRIPKGEIDGPLPETIIEAYNKGQVTPGSTDVGDVSYITPTAQINTVCQAFGTPGHSWQNTVTSGMSIGHKGMMLAAKALALATLDLQTQPELLQAARQEFETATGGKPYVSPLPDDAAPLAPPSKGSKA
jgi:aminobenzoyl-glutamate utilization protein B